MKNFAEDMGITGHLTIIRKWNDGGEEVLLDDSNIIVSGMGAGLSYLFTGSGSDSVLDYQIDRFQVGVSGPPEGGVVSSIYELSSQLGESDYGAGSNLFIKVNGQLTGRSLTADRAFALIPKNKVTRIGDSSVRYTLVLDEEACNDLTGAYSEELNLNEVGMFMKNPTGSTSDKSILVCYRTFSNIRKTSDFSLIFRWTLNF
jgi:hypothetical protein